MFKRYPHSIPPWENKFDEKFLLTVFNEKIFRVVQHSVHLRVVSV